MHVPHTSAVPRLPGHDTTVCLSYTSFVSLPADFFNLMILTSSISLFHHL